MIKKWVLFQLNNFKYLLQKCSRKGVVIPAWKVPFKNDVEIIIVCFYYNNVYDTNYDRNIILIFYR